MRLSFQTVCIIFGVTLVHLFIITALSPLGGQGMSPLATLPDLVIEETSSTDESSVIPSDETTASETLPAFSNSELLADPPARSREEASTGSATVLDIPATRRPVEAMPRS